MTDDKMDYKKDDVIIRAVPSLERQIMELRRDLKLLRNAMGLLVWIGLVGFLAVLILKWDLFVKLVVG